MLGRTQDSPKQAAHPGLFTLNTLQYLLQVERWEITPVWDQNTPSPRGARAGPEPGQGGVSWGSWCGMQPLLPPHSLPSLPPQSRAHQGETPAVTPALPFFVTAGVFSIRALIWSCCIPRASRGSSQPVWD